MVEDKLLSNHAAHRYAEHVGGLELFRKPDGAGPDYLRGLRDDLLKHNEVPDMFRRRPARPVNTAFWSR